MESRFVFSCTKMTTEQADFLCNTEYGNTSAVRSCEMEAEWNGIGTLKLIIYNIPVTLNFVHVHFQRHWLAVTVICQLLAQYNQIMFPCS